MHQRAHYSAWRNDANIIQLLVERARDTEIALADKTCSDDDLPGSHVLSVVALQAIFQKESEIRVRFRY